MASVGCVYPKNYNGKIYTFHCPDSIMPTLSIGDKVIVKDVNGYSVVEVAKLNRKAFGKGERNVIQRVAVEAGEAYAKARKKKLRLEAQIKERVEQLSHESLYRQYALVDPTMACLVEQLDSIDL